MEQLTHFITFSLGNQKNRLFGPPWLLSVEGRLMSDHGQFALLCRATLIFCWRAFQEEEEFTIYSEQLGRKVIGGVQNL